MISCGSTHLKARHSSIGVVVTCLAVAPALFAIRYTSCGLLLYEWIRPIVLPSGDTSPAFPPVIDVSFSRGPPSVDIAYR